MFPVESDTPAGRWRSQEVHGKARPGSTRELNRELPSGIVHLCVGQEFHSCVPFEEPVNPHGRPDHFQTMKRLCPLLLLLALLGCQTASRHDSAPRVQWTPEQANAWYAKQPWFVGCNFTPSTAINQLEMWQADTWDANTIDRELGWAHDFGFTSIRVFLHDLVWQKEHRGLLRRMEHLLGIAEKHQIGVMFVLFDSVWDPFPKPGKQREPYPHRHNSGWVQSPGQEILKDPARQEELKDYVQGVIGHFRNDRRVHAWDLFNEPDYPVPQYRDIEL